MPVAIGIFVLGAITTVAVPLAQNSIRRERAAAVARDLREFAQAFQKCARQRGDWPPATTITGQVPAGMEELLPLRWSRRTPLGGRYLWSPDTLQAGQRIRAAIAFWPRDREPLTTDLDLLLEVDRTLDDGDLHTGKFQLGYRDQPFFVLEP